MGKKKSLQFLEGVTTDSPTGDDLVSGPTSSTDNAVVRHDGTEGDIQGSGVTIDDSNNMTVPGAVNLQGGLNVSDTDVTISSNTFAKPSTVSARITSGSGPLNTISGASDGDYLILHNKSGSDIVIANDSGAGGFLTGTGDDLELADDASITLRYGDDSRWEIVGGSGGGGLKVELYAASTGALTAAYGKHYIIDLDDDLTVTLPDISKAGTIKFTLADGDTDSYTLTIDPDASDAFKAAGNKQTDGEEMTVNTLGSWFQLESDTGDNSWAINGPATGGTWPAATTTEAGAVKKSITVGAYASSDQAGLTSGTYYKALFNTEEFDDDNVFDSATNYRFTPPAGKYLITANVGAAADNTDAIRSYTTAIYKNGSQFKTNTPIGNVTSGQTDAIYTNITCIVSLNGSDYIEIYARAYTSSGGWKITGGQHLTYFSAHRISD